MITRVFFAIPTLLITFLLYAGEPTALFSPQDGPKAFAQVFSMIRNAKEYVHLVVYSWRGTDLAKALEDAAKSPSKPKIRLVLHDSVAKNSKNQKKFKELQALGVEFKRAKMNMHEKFVLVDGRFLVNPSANMTDSAANDYSEAFTFFTDDPEAQGNPQRQLINDFRQEFTVLWNSGSYLWDEDERFQPLTDYTKVKESKVINLPRQADLTLYSSSMNWEVKPNTPDEADYAKGKFIELIRKNGEANQPWLVRDKMIELIDNAQETIVMAINHFNIKDVADALLRAAAPPRNIKIRLSVDNQEFKKYSRPGDIEMTPYFVAEWKKRFPDRPVPVRVKYYSHCPDPATWQLNHHKFMLVDNNKLFSGSFNLSHQAEHEQFDNLVLFNGAAYQHLYQQYNQEFEHLWTWSREGKEPKKEVRDLFFQVKEGGYPLHINDSMALDWNEAIALQDDVEKMAPGLFAKLNKGMCKYTHYVPDPTGGKNGKFIFAKNE